MTLEEIILRGVYVKSAFLENSPLFVLFNTLDLWKKYQSD